MMKQNLIIGIGQFGCEVADVYARKLNTEDRAHVMAIDTDARVMENVSYATPISMASHLRICDILDNYDTKLIQPWFPCDRENDCVEYFEMLSMYEGSNQWRMKALLSLYFFLADKRSSRPFFAKLEEVEEALENDDAPTSKKLDIYIAASLAGGTGSGLFFVLSVYLKKYFAKRGIEVSSVRALLALPDICEDRLTPEQRVKAQANTYAALREMNAVNFAADGEDGISLRVGHPDDKIFGVLYDSEAPEFRVPENRPINEIYLFRRIPGFRSIQLHTKMMADSIDFLVNDTKLTETTTDAVYGGISIANTVYPADGIVDYISYATVLEYATDEWMHLFEKTAADHPRTKVKISDSEKLDVDRLKTIIDAVLDSAETLCSAETESASKLLNRTYSDYEAAVSPSPFVPERYMALLEEAVYSEFKTDGTERFKKLFDENNEALGATRNDKKARKALFNSKINRNELLKQIKNGCRDIASYYKNGLFLIEGEGSIERMLKDENDPLSIVQNIIKDEGKQLHPSYVLIRLCQLYRCVDKSLFAFRRQKTQLKNEENPYDLPEWIFTIHDDVAIDCSYGSAGVFRFRDLFEDKTSHVGRKYYDKNVFLYDLETVYKRIRSFFTSNRMETVLVILGRLIASYCEFFTELGESVKDVKDMAEASRNNLAGNYGMTFYTGASAREKEAAYVEYRRFVRELSTSPFEESFDERLGKLAFSESSGSTERESSQGITKLMLSFKKDVEKHCFDSSFYTDYLEKNVMRVLLEQNEKDGGLKKELALCKAFCAGQFPLIYNLPDIYESYKISKEIKRQVRVDVPSVVSDYLTQVSEEFGGRTPTRIMEQILSDAGEYYGEVFFDGKLPDKELRVIRKVMGIRLSLIEVLNESTKDGIYYKSYKKALAMREDQNTDLWNPHLVCGLTDGSLPRICDDINSLINN